MNYKDQLKRDEALRLKPYRCTSNKLTIGFARNLEDRGITEEEAEHMFENDINNCIRELSVFPWYSRSPLPIQECLINMCFNLGLPRLLLFKRMIEALRNKDYERAAIEALDSLWARQVGDRAKRLAAIMRAQK